MKWSEGPRFENPEPGSYLARCYALTDLGTQQHSFQGETWSSRDVRLSFELPGELMTGIYDPKAKGRPHSVHVTVKQSLHPRSKMRKLLKGWRGKDFTKEEADAFDPKKLIGLPCQITLVQNGEYVDIDSLSPVRKSDKVPNQVNKSVYFSLEKDEFNRAAFDALHENTQEKIKKSPEFAALSSGGDDSQPDPEPESDQTPGNDDPF